MSDGASESITLTMKDRTGATMFTGQQAATVQGVQEDPSCGAAPDRALLLLCPAQRLNFRAPTAR
jgi:hypothetical protein